MLEKKCHSKYSLQQCSLSTVLNPLQVLDKILIKTNEGKKYKGAGARKIYCSKIVGVSETVIQEYINNQPKAQCLNPEFKNKADLVPVKSSGVLNRFGRHEKVLCPH